MGRTKGSTSKKTKIKAMEQSVEYILQILDYDMCLRVNGLWYVRPSYEQTFVELMAAAGIQAKRRPLNKIY